MTYGHFTERSAYAELVCEDVDGGGLLVFVKQARGSEDGEARITLSANQVSSLRTWLATDRDADTCACPELHPGMAHETWTDELARSEPGDIPLHLETQAEREARTTAPGSDDLTLSEPAYLAWRDRIRRAHGS
jgi:hypothetical protein